MRRSLGLVALLVACGRSELVPGHVDVDGGVFQSTSGGAGGNGPSGATATSTSNVTASVGTGAGGSAPLACTSLVQSGALTAIPTLGPGTADNARFHWLPDGRIAVAYRPFDPMNGLRIASTSVSFRSAWPPPHGAPTALVDHAGESFAVDRTAAPLLGLLTKPADGFGIAYGPVDPEQGPWVPSTFIDFAADQAVFVRQGHDQTLVATSGLGASPGGSYQLRATFLDASGKHGPYNVGCSPYRLQADAIAVPNGWLLARTSRLQDTCSAIAPTEPPDTIALTWIVGGMPFVAGEIPFGGASSQLTFLPRADGAWLLYWSDPLHVSAMGLDATGKIVGIVPVTSLAESPFAFGADALDVGFVLALYDAASDGTSALRVVVADWAGHPIAEARIDNPPKPTTPPQVAFDGATRQILVGFAGIANAVQSVYLARFSCP